MSAPETPTGTSSIKSSGKYSISKLTLLLIIMHQYKNLSGDTKATDQADKTDTPLLSCERGKRQRIHCKALQVLTGLQNGFLRGRFNASFIDSNKKYSIVESFWNFTGTGEKNIKRRFDSVPPESQIKPCSVSLTIEV